MSRRAPIRSTSSFGLTDTGMHRRGNEDAFLDSPGLWAVADGMGGHSAGDIASKLTLETMGGFFHSHDGPVHERLVMAAERANEAVVADGTKNPGRHGMGSTVVAMAYASSPPRVVVVHAGDSRCYRVRGEEILQLTRDHSFYEETIAANPEMSVAHRAQLPKNIITRAIGIEPAVDVGVTIDKPQVGDLYLLCSDGLTGMLTDDEILREVLAMQPSGKSSGMTNLAKRLILAANDAGGDDNITVVLIRFEA